MAASLAIHMIGLYDLTGWCCESCYWDATGALGVTMILRSNDWLPSMRKAQIGAMERSRAGKGLFSNGMYYTVQGIYGTGLILQYRISRRAFSRPARYYKLQQVNRAGIGLEMVHDNMRMPCRDDFEVDG